MRLLVASDSHRAAGNLLDIVELHLEDSDVLLFLGDGENDLENVRMLYPRLHILQVAGNCDWGSDLPAWGTAKLGGKTVLYTHGHPFHVKFGLAELEQAAREALELGITPDALLTDVEEALSALGGVTSAKADLEGKCATVTLTGAVSDQSLTDAVTEAGYEVVSIQ